MPQKKEPFDLSAIEWLFTHQSEVSPLRPLSKEILFSN